MRMKARWELLLRNQESSILPDGGMPEKTNARRALESAAAIHLFLMDGSTCRRGRFRSQVRKLVEFILRSKIRTPSIKAVISWARESTPAAKSWAEKTDRDDFSELDEMLLCLSFEIAKEQSNLKTRKEKAEERRAMENLPECPDDPGQMAACSISDIYRAEMAARKELAEKYGIMVE